MDKPLILDIPPGGRQPWRTVPGCFVEATAGWHYCVMDFDGRVYDPFNEDRHSLAHPDYKRVGGVLGLFKRIYNQSR